MDAHQLFNAMQSYYDEREFSEFWIKEGYGIKEIIEEAAKEEGLDTSQGYESMAFELRNIRFKVPLNEFAESVLDYANEYDTPEAYVKGDFYSDLVTNVEDCEVIFYEDEYQKKDMQDLREIQYECEIQLEETIKNKNAEFLEGYEETDDCKEQVKQILLDEGFPEDIHDEVNYDVYVESIDQSAETIAQNLLPKFKETEEWPDDFARTNIYFYIVDNCKVTISLDIYDEPQDFN